MRPKTIRIAATALLLAGCNQTTRQQPSNTAQPTSPRDEVPPIPPPGTGPDARTPFGKPANTVDPKSDEAAADLVRGFVDLLNARKFGDAWMLFGAGAPPRAEFEREYSRYSDLRVRAEAPGSQEGAAGSVYVSIPISISGTIGDREEHRSATVILRRVNDVPGSTEAERHWHIDRIDWEQAR
jgi:hypothetical protein